MKKWIIDNEQLMKKSTVDGPWSTAVQINTMVYLISLFFYFEPNTYVS